MSELTAKCLFHLILQDVIKLPSVSREWVQTIDGVGAAAAFVVDLSN
jgi:hypothetical protein